MSWTPLSQRLSQLPLILAGPLLRRTEPGAVTVWLALRHACEVTLNIYPTVDGEGWLIAGRDSDEENGDRSPLLQGTRTTIAIGKHLHLVAVTASPTTTQLLQAGQIYAYDLEFRSINKPLNPAINPAINPANQEPTWTLQTALTADSESAATVSISYFDHHLPTFCLPPDNLNHLQIMHGSCRKLHGEGKDALAILDGLIAKSCTQANHRPHQLFLTGDQIYGDDVADPLLLALTEAGNTLLGWEEPLPLDAAPTSERSMIRPQDVKPGERSPLVTLQAGLTASLYNQPKRAKSHLLSFGEYCAIYLFAWSPVLWGEFPRGETVWTTANRTPSRRAGAWNAEVKNLERALRSLPQVRRALANIPTYMICDDHDISDDWFLNRNWCLRVLSRALGRRIVQNGLLGYALFQAWGNTPDQFTAGRSGATLLDAASQWSASAGTDSRQESLIARYLGLPALNEQGEPKFQQDGNTLILDRHPDALEWHYVVRSTRHEVIVLDTRTWRGYPLDSFTKAPPMLLSPTAFDRQLHQVLTQTNQLKQSGESRSIAT
ncbi:MAG TPA: PhoD-like phosphatase, partial [Allocoleopsis sp.]